MIAETQHNKNRCVNLGMQCMSYLFVLEHYRYNSYHVCLYNLLLAPEAKVVKTITRVTSYYDYMGFLNSFIWFSYKEPKPFMT